MRTEKDRQRFRKRSRKRRLHELRGQLENATDPAERQRLIAKIRRVSSTAPVPEK